jgi:hypothetical protein
MVEPQLGLSAVGRGTLGFLRIKIRLGPGFMASRPAHGQEEIDPIPRLGHGWCI